MELTDNRGRTPLFCATESPYVKGNVRELLLRGANRHARDDNGQTIRELVGWEDDIESIFQESQKKMRWSRDFYWRQEDPDYELKWKKSR
jgi:ankyrin repeat protein